MRPPLALTRVKWDMMSSEEKVKEGKTLSDVAIEAILDEDELEECV